MMLLYIPLSVPCITFVCVCVLGVPGRLRAGLQVQPRRRAQEVQGGPQEVPRRHHRAPSSSPASTHTTESVRPPHPPPFLNAYSPLLYFFKVV